jgi:hypothetical protein
MGGWLDQYQNAGSTGVRQPIIPDLTPKKQKVYTDAEAEALNKKALAESTAQAKKEYINDYVKQGTKQALLESPFNLAASFTPVGTAIFAGQSGAQAIQDVANDDYLSAGINAAFALPLVGKTKKLLKGLPKGTNKVVSSGPKVTAPANNRLKKAADYEIEGAIRDIEQNPSAYKTEYLHELRGEYARRLNSSIRPQDINSSFLDQLIQNPTSYNQLSPEALASLSNLDKTGKLTKKFKKPLQDLKEKAIRVLDKSNQMAGHIVDPFTNPYAKTTNAAVIKEANKKLTAGLGIKKLNIPVKLIEGQGGNMNVEVNLRKFMEQHPELSEFAQHVPEGFQSTGVISLPTVARKNRTLTEVLKGENPYNKAWGSAGLKKAGDFPFGYLDQKKHTIISDALKKSGLSAEINQAIKKTVQEKGMDLFSGGTGHTISGAKRYIRELIAGRVEPKGPKKSVETFQNWVNSNKPTLEAIGSGEIPMTSAIHDRLSPMIFRYKLRGGQHNNWLDNLH